MAKKINKATQAGVLTSLGNLLENGFSLSSSILCLKIKYPNLLNILNKMEDKLNSGEKLAITFRLLNLSEIMVSQLSFAEQSGLIKKVIGQSGKLLKIQMKQLKKIKLLMIYPMFILTFLITIMIFIKTFFKFDSPNSKISIYLEIFDAVSFLLIIGLVIYLLIEFIKIKNSTEYDAINKKINLPIIGSIYKLYYEYNFLFITGSMIKNGMKISDICKINFQNNSSYEILKNKLVLNMKNGYDLSYFIKNENQIPNELDIIIDSGTNHKNLGSEILALSQLKYEETLNGAEKIITKIQPIVFGIIAILILNTYLKILIPVYGMMEGMY